MEIPWIYYVNILLIPLLFGYLTAVNYTHTWRIRSCTFGWWMFYILCDVIGLGVQTFCGFKRTILADTWDYSLILVAISFAIMVVVLAAPRTPLAIFLPRYVEDTAIEEKAEEDEKKKKRKKIFRIIIRIVFFLLYALLLVAVFTMRWYEQTFNVDFDALLYTIAAPAKGTGGEVVETALLKIIPPAVLMLMLYWISVRRAEKVNGKKKLVFGRAGREKNISQRKIRYFARIMSVVMIVYTLATAVVLLKLPEYIRSISQMSTIYEEYYVDPDDVKLSFDDGKRNLILIILESMETTYASKEEGGRNDVNYIPYLTQLAKDNVSFSDTEKLGGFNSCTGTGWTMGATIATSSGVPFSFPVGQNSLGHYDSIAGGLTTMGEVLEGLGYNLEVVFGSDASFAGTSDYYVQHGNYKVFDLDDYYENNYVEQDFYEWWGVRDEIVFDALRDELNSLSKEDKPFAVTTFTMDTHAPGGFICSRCKENYDNQLGNVLECNERQIKKFLEWCELQPWYENTTIVLTGDHPRMDSRLIDNLEPADRRVYNCFINSPKEVSGETTNRTFTTLDIFPTVISSMGIDIPGDMLGLGTDMFSGKQTLAEKLGMDVLNEQLGMKSDYYMRNFY